MIKNCRMSINKWTPLVLAINIAMLCLTINASMAYFHRNEIVKSEKPITNYSILEVNCSGGFRGGSTIRIAYLGKYYDVGVSRKKCKRTESTNFYYDKLHDTVFEKDELSMRQIVFFFTMFAFSLLLWRYPEVRRCKATKKEQ